MATITANSAIKTTNITCMQNLNDLWDTIDHHTDRLSRLSFNSSSSYAVDSTFRKSYDLSCWLRDQLSSRVHDAEQQQLEEHGNEGTFQKISITISPPHILCKRHTAPAKAVRAALLNLMHQQVPLLTAVGIEASSGQISASKSPINDLKSRKHSDEFQKLLSRWMLRSAQMDRRSMYLQSIRYTGQAHKLNEPEGDGAVRWRIINAEVDHYLHNGNVTLIGLSPTDEVMALRRLRRFLVDFADEIHFRMDHWHRVIIALYEPSASKKLNKEELYVVHQVQAAHWILKVPINFKRATLLHALRRNIPFVRASALQ